MVEKHLFYTRVQVHTKTPQNIFFVRPSQKNSENNVLGIFLSKPQAWYAITRQRVWYRRRRMASPKVYFCGVIWRETVEMFTDLWYNKKEEGGGPIDMASIYEYILSRIAEDLLPYGFKRNGKGRLFYRYSADKKVGCVFEMQKSMFNLSDDYSFTFNLGCIALYNMNGYRKDKLTLETVKLALHPELSVRLGHLSRGFDYWWNITDKILNDYSIEEYYDRFLYPDIIKGAEYLNEQAHKKESVYKKDT